MRGFVQLDLGGEGTAVAGDGDMRETPRRAPDRRARLGPRFGFSLPPNFQVLIRTEVQPKLASANASPSADANTPLSWRLDKASPRGPGGRRYVQAFGPKASRAWFTRSQHPALRAPAERSGRSGRMPSAASRPLAADRPAPPAMSSTWRRRPSSRRRSTAKAWSPMIRSAGTSAMAARSIRRTGAVRTPPERARTAVDALRKTLVQHGPLGETQPP